MASALRDGPLLEEAEEPDAAPMPHHGHGAHGQEPLSTDQPADHDAHGTDNHGHEAR
ncbi:MAG: hypothetical protein AB2A00_04100 [Myxococcota bacterium]